MTACERTINIQFDVDTQAGFLDINQCLSKLNRKLFRQGEEVVVESVAINTYSSNVTELQIGRLPQSYCTSNAWVKALAHWNEQQLEEANETGTDSMIAKWRDFKVYMNRDHADATGTQNLLPRGYGLSDVSGGTVDYEWAYSKIVMPNTDVNGDPSPGETQEYFLHMLGDDNDPTSKGIILAWAQSRAKGQTPDPNIVTGTYGGLWTEIEDVGEISEEIIENVSQRNNEPPYPMSADTNTENYPGAANVGQSNDTKGHRECVLELGSSIRSTYGSFVAPLGLLHLSLAGGELVGTEVVNIQIKIAAGPHQGILARSMKEAN